MSGLIVDLYNHDQGLVKEVVGHFMVYEFATLKTLFNTSKKMLAISHTLGDMEERARRWMDFFFVKDVGYIQHRSSLEVFCDRPQDGDVQLWVDKNGLKGTVIRNESIECAHIQECWREVDGCRCQMFCRQHATRYLCTLHTPTPSIFNQKALTWIAFEFPEMPWLSPD